MPVCMCAPTYAHHTYDSKHQLEMELQFRDQFSLPKKKGKINNKIKYIELYEYQLH